VKRATVGRSYVHLHHPLHSPRRTHAHFAFAFCVAPGEAEEEEQKSKRRPLFLYGRTKGGHLSLSLSPSHSFFLSLCTTKFTSDICDPLGKTATSLAAVAAVAAATVPFCKRMSARGKMCPQICAKLKERRGNKRNGFKRRWSKRLQGGNFVPPCVLLKDCQANVTASNPISEMPGEGKRTFPHL